MDRLTSMRIFTRVVDLGSYSAVASEEGISAQMVGKHVLGLEQWLGESCFTRPPASRPSPSWASFFSLAVSGCWRSWH